MGLSRDGSIGILTMGWRRVVIDGRLYLEEGFSTQPVMLWGPLPDEATCTALIMERAKAVRETVDRLKAQLRERYPDSVEVRRTRNPLKDDDDG